MRDSNDVELIINYLLDDSNETKLTKRLQDKFNLLNRIDNWLCGESKSDRDVIVLMKKHYNISESSAYLHLKEAKKVFVMKSAEDKKYELQRMFERNDEYQKLAKETKDLKALAMFEKNKIEMMKLIPDASNVPKFDLNKTPVYMMQFDPTLIGITPIPLDRLDKLFTEFNLKKNPGKIASFEDLSFEEIANAKD